MDILFRTVDPVVTILRPYLTPITTSLPAPVRDFAVSQIGPLCYETTIERLDLVSSPECSKLLVSKTIGVGIVALSVFVKIPQLLKLLSSRSARGVSFTSYLLETAAQVITLAYNTRQGNPFSTYGEIAILALQNVLVAALVLEFQGRRTAAAVFVAGIASAGYALFDPKIVDAKMLQYAQAATIPLGLMSKIPQIWTVAKEKSTGQLSAFAVSDHAPIGSVGLSGNEWVRAVG